MFSADERYEFGCEDLVKCMEDTECITAINALVAENHKETGAYDLPFNPDYDRYMALAKQHDLVFFTVRWVITGEIVGFALFFLDTEIQQKDIVAATQSLNYIAKGHRGPGYLFMKYCDDMLKNQGVDSVCRQASSKFDVGKIYERMGYHLVEKSYLRRL